MKPETQLDYAVFQLTPTRTRCELHVAAQGKTYKLASGLLKPFVAHLRAAEEQLAKGGYSIRLEPPDPGSASWFTKGTMERFVRFVSTPEVLERSSTVEVELMELEETINVQANDTNETSESVQVDDQPSKTSPSPLSTGGKPMSTGILEKSAVLPTKRESGEGVESSVEENSKQRLLRALDARRLMLQKEQGMAFARAIAAGFLMEHMGDLVVFAECFGANRLREACIKFISLCKKRQEAGLWLEDLDLAAAEAGAHPEMAFMGVPGDNAMGSFFKSREYPNAWSDLHGGDMKLDDHHRAMYPTEGRLFIGEDGAEKKLTRHGSLENQTGDFWQLVSNMRTANGSGIMGDFTGEYGPIARARNGPIPVGGKNQLTPEELHAATVSHPSLLSGGFGYTDDSMGNGEYREGETGTAPSLVRGHPFMPAWQGLPQNQYMQNVRPLSPHGTLHPSFPKHIEPPYGFSGPGRGAPGVAYPPYMGGPYLQPGYTDSPWQVPEGSSNWMGQVQPSLPPQFWPSNQGYVDTSRPMARDPMEGSTHTNERQEVNSSRASLMRDKEHGADVTHVKQSSIGIGEEIASRDGDETMYSSAKLSDDHRHKVADPLAPEHDNPDELLDERDEDVLTRRYPRRSASPSRRSSSPMRKVQISRSGPRRSGMVVIRNINYIAPNSQDRSSKGDDGAESSSSWSEDADSAANGSDDGLQTTAESVRVSVQDVIGLFENQKGDSNETKRKSSKKETRKSSSKKGASNRGTDAGDVCGDINDEAVPAKGEKPSNYEKDHYTEEASLFPLRVGRGRLSSSSLDVGEFESEARNHSHRAVGVKDMLILPEREGINERATPRHSSEMFAEQQGPASQRKPIADDSFIVSGQAGLWGTANTGNITTIDPDLELANKQTGDSEQQIEEETVDKRLPVDDSIIMLNRMARERNVGTSIPLNLESEMPVDHYFEVDKDETAQTSNNFEPDDLFMMPERSKETVNRSWTSPLDYDMQLLEGEMIDIAHQVHEGDLENGLQEQEDERVDKSKAISSKKNEREAKTKAMQEMLERRKAGMGKRSDKPNPLAEAQLRAEKLRAYKASLQKSKKEKEEEERKRIEDLKNQRRERIAARSSLSSGGAQAAASMRGARSPATPPQRISKSSPTVPRKLAASSPGEHANGSSSVSPNVARAKASNASRLPRLSAKVVPSSKPAENLLSRSVSSISELRKEAHKTVPLVRASTGSRRLSPFKNVENEADKEASTTKARASSEKVVDKAASTSKANGLAEIKKRPISTITSKKGSPATKEAKGEGSSPAKLAKIQSIASKPLKTAMNTPATAKSSVRKETTSSTDAARVSMKEVCSDARDVKDAVVQATTSPSFIRLDNEMEHDKLGTTCKAVELSDSSPREEMKVDANNGHARIRSPESNDTVYAVPRTAHFNDEMVRSDVLVKILEKSTEDTSCLDPGKGSPFPKSSQSEYNIFTEDVLADGPLEIKESNDRSRVDEEHGAPIAWISSLDNDAARDTEVDVNENNGPSSSTPEYPATSKSPLQFPQYNSPLGLHAESPIAASSKNYPQLQEAIQQAHSPDAIPVKPETVRSRKKWGDSMSQKTPKEHAKGFKRLLRLGRKSSRTSAQNSSDWISPSTSDNDEDGDEVRDLPSINGKNLGIASSVESLNINERASSSISVQQQLKVQQSNSGNSSTKASRSFFSLSTFRSKSAEVKARS